MKRDNLHLPIYLNQRIVFDLLAILEDGFAQMKKIDTSHQINKSTSIGIDSEVGIENVFAFLKTQIKPSLKRNTDKDYSQSESQEKIHTPNSLFAKLYEKLYEDEKIINVSDENSLVNIKEGNFIEVEGKLLKNPLISLLESFQGIMELALVFDNTGTKKKNNNKNNNEEKNIIKQIKFLSEHLKNGDMFDLICKVEKSKLHIVLPVYIKYFYNENMNEIIDGNYKILGKVTNIVKNEEEGINLLRNTTLSLLNESILNNIFECLENVEGLDIKYKNTKTIINSPAIQVIPIAIYR